MSDILVTLCVLPSNNNIGLAAHIVIYIYIYVYVCVYLFFKYVKSSVHVFLKLLHYCFF